MHDIIKDLVDRRTKEAIDAAMSLDTALLAEAARKTRAACSRDRVFLYGFIYFSTFCINNCNFCYFRKENDIKRYRKTEDEILAVADDLGASGVNLVDLTMGEDSYYKENSFARFIRLASEVMKRTGLPVMASPGVMPNSALENLAKQNVLWYALYQETFNRELFGRLRAEQDFDGRMNAKQHAKRLGMSIEEGILTGVTETPEQLAESVAQIGNGGAKQLRVMTFEPHKSVPLGQNTRQDITIELKIISILRLLHPSALIPASLDVGGLDGLTARLNSGANVVTSIIPPSSGLSGVAQRDRDVASSGRTADAVRAILIKLGLKQGSNTEYLRFIRGELVDG
ncbi:MAG: methylornithine synthase PylB [Defluviitaleaceae bacterium]|nr:methylornithine synthase PylB [Defluviitaleaceae bacterium]MCL2836632.1 methylornithine synthase PylB [Defluviitaleaceae bacterium]